MRKFFLAGAALLLSAQMSLAAGTWLGADLQDTGAVNEEIANASSTGTTLNTLSKYVNGQAVIMATSDINLARGVCMSGCGTTGTAVIAFSGNAQLLIDAAHTPTAGHFVQISTTNAGYGSDTGAATCPTNANQTVGIVQSNVSGSIYNVKLGTFGCAGSLSAGQSAVTEYISHGTSTYTAPTNATIFHIIACGAAGGGSSGIPANTSANSTSGGSGGSGGCQEAYLTAAQMGATATVVVGQGGAGGTTSTTVGTGNAGSDGANSTVTPAGTGPVLTGYHGGGATATAANGKGGTCAGAATGTTAATVCDWGGGAAANLYAGASGQAGASGLPSAINAVLMGMSGPGAPAGGGVGSTGTVASAGASGTTTLVETSAPAAGTGGTSGGNGGNGASPAVWIPWLGAGSTGGSGGACAPSACQGGNAGTSGLLASGAGGGGSLGTTGSGAGAAGGDGGVWIEAKF